MLNPDDRPVAGEIFRNAEKTDEAGAGSPADAQSTTHDLGALVRTQAAQLRTLESAIAVEEKAAATAYDALRAHKVTGLELYQRQCRLLVEWRQAQEQGSVTEWKEELGKAWGGRAPGVIQGMLAQGSADPFLWSVAFARMRTFGRVDLIRTLQPAKSTVKSAPPKPTGKQAKAASGATGGAPPANGPRPSDTKGAAPPQTGAAGAPPSDPAPPVIDPDISEAVIPERILTDTAHDPDELRTLAGRAATLAREGLELAQQFADVNSEEASIKIELRDVQAHFGPMLEAVATATAERDKAVRQVEDLRGGMDHQRAEIARLRNAASASAPTPPQAPAATGSTVPGVGFKWPKATAIPSTVDAAWTVLGIKNKRGTKDEVADIYRQCIRAWHPDRHPNDAAKAHLHTLRLNKALRTSEGPLQVVIYETEPVDQEGYIDRSRGPRRRRGRGAGRHQRLDERERRGRGEVAVLDPSGRSARNSRVCADSRVQ